MLAIEGEENDNKKEVHLIADETETLTEDEQITQSTSLLETSQDEQEAE